MDLGLDGLVVVITGGASGIGAACAEAFTAEGARVVVADRDLALASAQVARLDTAPDTALALPVDVADQQSIGDLFEHVDSRFGRLDVLVTSAAIHHDEGVDATTVSDWDRVIDTNLRGTFLCCQSAMRRMRTAGGRIVVIGSMAASSGGTLAGPAYTASKGGISALVRSLARDGAPDGIIVNGVVPGVIDSPMTAIFSQGRRRSALNASLLQRWGRPEEVASVVVFLASPKAAAFIVGTEVAVNGGARL